MTYDLFCRQVKKSMQLRKEQELSVQKYMYCK